MCDFILPDLDLAYAGTDYNDRGVLLCVEEIWEQASLLAHVSYAAAASVVHWYRIGGCSLPDAVKLLVG